MATRCARMLPAATVAGARPRPVAPSAAKPRRRSLTPVPFPKPPRPAVLRTMPRRPTRPRRARFSAPWARRPPTTAPTSVAVHPTPRLRTAPRAAPRAPTAACTAPAQRPFTTSTAMAPTVMVAPSSAITPPDETPRSRTRPTIPSRAQALHRTFKCVFENCDEFSSFLYSVHLATILICLSRFSTFSTLPSTLSDDRRGSYTTSFRNAVTRRPSLATFCFPSIYFDKALLYADEGQISPGLYMDAK